MVIRSTRRKNDMKKLQLSMPLEGSPAMQERIEYVDNIVTTTWYDVRNQLFSDIWQITPFLDMLNQKGKIRSRMPVGRYFELPIGYAQADQNQKWFGRGDTFSEAEKQLWTTLQYQRRNLGDNIVRYWDDEMKNKGKAQILDYSKNLIDNHKMTMDDTMGNAVWASQGQNSINALPDLISKTPTVGTVGGIDRTANPYVRNISFEFTGTAALNLIPTMRTVFNECSKKKGKGRQTPDIVLTTQTIYEEYEDQALALGQIQLASNKGTARADLGFGGLSYKGAEMYWDPNCPEGDMYFLNSDTIEFAYDPDAYMEMTPWKSKHNSLDRYAQVVTVCNLLFNNFQKNAVIHSIPTA
jgi:hypothetical protein